MWQPGGLPHPFGSCKRAEGVEDKGDLDGEEGTTLVGEQVGETGIVDQIEAQLSPGCAGTDGRKVELGKLCTTVGSDCCFHTAKIRKIIEIRKVLDG